MPKPSLPRDQRASISIIAAGGMVVCMACAALTIDLGSWVNTHTSLQAATDAASLGAVMNTATSQATAQQILTHNGFTTSTLQSVITGTYCPDPSISPTSRFSAGVSAHCAVLTGPVPNAVQLASLSDSPVSFAGLFNGRRSMPAGASSTAARLDVAGLEAGSTVAQVNGGLVNAALSTLVGRNISLSLISYNGLIVTNIPALNFLDALAAQNHITGTYGQLANANVSVQSVLHAEASVLTTQGGTSAINAAAGLQNLATQIGAATTINLSRLIDVTNWSGDTIGSPSATALQPMINASDLLSATLQLTNNNSIAAGIGVGVPGVGTLTVTASAIEPPQQPYFGFGPVGTSVHTAQIRLQMQLSLLNAVNVAGVPAPVTIPLYIEIGSGDAAISGITCGANPAIDSVVSVTASSAVAGVYLGTVPVTAMRNFSQSAASQLSPATFVNLAGLLTITGSSDAQLGQGHATTSFNQTQMHAGAMHTISSTQLTGTLLQSLLASTSLQVNVLGILPLAISNLAKTQLKTLLSAVPLDGVIDPALQALGVQLGVVTYAATGVRCGIPVLVQ